MFGREYSQGYHATVNLTSRAEQREFPGAEIVKVFYSNDPDAAFRLYLLHQIAQTLFPPHFIRPVGYTTDINRVNGLLQSLLGKPYRFEHRLYSQKAPVHPGHAIFSKHMRLLETDYGLVKAMTCLCHTCLEHINLHRTLRLKERASIARSRMEVIGLHPDDEDQTDYCLSRDQEILFFEFKSCYELRSGIEYLKFEPDVALSRIGNTTPNQVEARRLIAAYALIPRVDPLPFFGISPIAF